MLQICITSGSVTHVRIPPATPAHHEGPPAVAPVRSTCFERFDRCAAFVQGIRGTRRTNEPQVVESCRPRGRPAAHRLGICSDFDSGTCSNSGSGSEVHSRLRTPIWPTTKRHGSAGRPHHRARRRRRDRPPPRHCGWADAKPLPNLRCAGRRDCRPDGFGDGSRRHRRERQRPDTPVGGRGRPGRGRRAGGTGNG